MSFDFEGDEVTDFTAALPSAVMEAPEAYPRGTYLTLQVQVRVKSVRVEEDRKGNLARKHMLALEEVNIVDVLTPTQRQQLLEQAQAQPAVEDKEYTVQEELGVEDVIPGQTTIDDHLEEARDIGLTPDPVVADEMAKIEDDDEHAWMDEDDDPYTSTHAAQVSF